MSVSKEAVRDAIFVFQLSMTALFSVGQFFHVVENGAEGVNLAMALCVWVFSLYGTRLAIAAHRRGPSRATWQVRFSNGAFLLTWSGVLVVELLEVGKTVWWDWTDTATITFVGLGLVGVRIWREREGLPANDPYLKGLRALMFKASPHIFQAVKIGIYGGSGWNPLSILVWSHATALSRTGLLWFSRNEDRQDRNRRGAWVAEIGNEGTWLITTAVWIWWWLFVRVA
jgi:hypothetical protein